MIDIKRNPKAIFALLQSELRLLRCHLMTHDQYGNIKVGKVGVVLSGNLKGVKGKVR